MACNLQRIKQSKQWRYISYQINYLLVKIQGKAHCYPINPINPFIFIHMLKEFSKTIHTSLISSDDIQLFQAGTHRRMYEKMGAHLMSHEGTQGTFFSVWAPNAKEVAVVGNFNEWQSSGFELYPRWDHSGIWEGFIPDIGKGTIYKYSIKSNTPS